MSVSSEIVSKKKKTDDEFEQSPLQQSRFSIYLYRTPWWFIVLIMVAIFMIIAVTRVEQKFDVNQIPRDWTVVVEDGETIEAGTVLMVSPDGEDELVAETKGTVHIDEPVVRLRVIEEYHIPEAWIPLIENETYILPETFIGLPPDGIVKFRSGDSGKVNVDGNALSGVPLVAVFAIPDGWTVPVQNGTMIEIGTVIATSPDGMVSFVAEYSGKLDTVDGEVTLALTDNEVTVPRDWSVGASDGNNARRGAVLAEAPELLTYNRGSVFVEDNDVTIFADTLTPFGAAFEDVQSGISMTLGVSLIAYSSALVIGLLVGLIRANPPQPPMPGATLRMRIIASVRLVVYNVLTFYVEVLRGLPILVTLLIVAFVIIPALKNSSIGFLFPFRGSSPPAAIIALAFTYGAFLSETFRAGIQSIEKGQIEAARSLGMTFLQTTRHIILPQAIRRILPPLGNDMVAMIKDSSLVAILGIRDLTQSAKISSAATFQYMPTYLTVATIYLTMTVVGSLFVKWLERRMRRFEQD